MHLNVIYLARLREAFGRRDEMVELPASCTVEHLVMSLRARGGVWASELAAGRAVRVAVNHEMITGFTASLNAGDEVAFFPPVTGG